MVFLLNLIFAILAFFGARYLLASIGATNPLATIVAVLVAIVVFLANLGRYVV